VFAYLCRCSVLSRFRSPRRAHDVR
jgi:hypothetical protein